MTDKIKTQGMTAEEIAELQELGAAGVAEIRFADRDIRMQPMSEIRKAQDATKNAGKPRTHRAVFSKSLHRTD